MPVNELPNYETEIKPDMYEHIAKYWTYKEKLLGLSYFTSVLGIVTVNLDKLAETGLTEADYPKTWDELYDQLVCDERSRCRNSLPAFLVYRAVGYGLVYLIESLQSRWRGRRPVLSPHC